MHSKSFLTLSTQAHTDAVSNLDSGYNLLYMEKILVGDDLWIINTK